MRRPGATLAGVFVMLTDSGFAELVRSIEALGYDEATASDFARRIGDTPEHDAAGLTIIRDGETILARLRLD
jgi:hypothetical protein